MRVKMPTLKYKSKAKLLVYLKFINQLNQYPQSLFHFFKRKLLQEAQDEVLRCHCPCLRRPCRRCASAWRRPPGGRELKIPISKCWISNVCPSIEASWKLPLLRWRVQQRSQVLSLFPVQGRPMRLDCWNRCPRVTIVATLLQSFLLVINSFLVSSDSPWLA